MVAPTPPPPSAVSSSTIHPTTTPAASGNGTNTAAEQKDEQSATASPKTSGGSVSVDPWMPVGLSVAGAAGAFVMLLMLRGRGYLAPNPFFTTMWAGPLFRAAPDTNNR